MIGWSSHIYPLLLLKWDYIGRVYMLGASVFRFGDQHYIVNTAAPNMYTHPLMLVDIIYIHTSRCEVKNRISCPWQVPKRITPPPLSEIMH